MFDFEGRIKQREADRAAKQDEEARRQMETEEAASQLYAKTEELIRNYGIGVTVEKRNRTIRLRRGNGDVLDIDVLNYPDGPQYDFETMHAKIPGKTRPHVPGKTRVETNKEIADVVLDWCGI